MAFRAFALVAAPMATAVSAPAEGCPRATTGFRTSDGRTGIGAAAWFSQVVRRRDRDRVCGVANDLGFTKATIGTLVGHARDAVTGRYIHTVDTLPVMAADTVAGFIRGLLEDKRFRQASYALDRASREAALVRLFEQ